jgi:hypothetical protein
MFIPFDCNIGFSTCSQILEAVGPVTVVKKLTSPVAPLAKFADNLSQIGFVIVLGKYGLAEFIILPAVVISKVFIPFAFAKFAAADFATFPPDQNTRPLVTAPVNPPNSFHAQAVGKKGELNSIDSACPLAILKPLKP